MTNPTPHTDPEDEGLPRQDGTQDITQEAIDATATAYADDPNLDVEDGLRGGLCSRGRDQLATDDAWVSETAQAIRAGHSPAVGQHDGSIPEDRPGERHRAPRRPSP